MPSISCVLGPRLCLQTPMVVMVVVRVVKKDILGPGATLNQPVKEREAQIKDRFVDGVT